MYWRGIVSVGYRSVIYFWLPGEFFIFLLIQILFNHLFLLLDIFYMSVLIF